MILTAAQYQDAYTRWGNPSVRAVDQHRPHFYSLGKAVERIDEGLFARLLATDVVVVFRENATVTEYDTDPDALRLVVAADRADAPAKTPAPEPETPATALVLEGDTKAARARSLLRQALADGPKSNREMAALAEAHGIDADSLSEQRKRMGIKATPIHAGGHARHGTMWALPAPEHVRETPKSVHEEAPPVHGLDASDAEAHAADIEAVIGGEPPATVEETDAEPAEGVAVGVFLPEWEGHSGDGEAFEDLLPPPEVYAVDDTELPSLPPTLKGTLNELMPPPIGAVVVDGIEVPTRPAPRIVEITDSQSKPLADVLLSEQLAACLADYFQAIADVPLATSDNDAWCARVVECKEDVKQVQANAQRYFDTLTEHIMRLQNRRDALSHLLGAADRLFWF